MQHFNVFKKSKQKSKLRLIAIIKKQEYFCHDSLLFMISFHSFHTFHLEQYEKQCNFVKNNYIKS